MQSPPFRSRTAPSLPARWTGKVARIAASLGISVEIWNGAGPHGQRLHLGSACRQCQRQEPRTFDRCRKRRAYLNRPEAPVPERLAEKCPQQMRLARLGGGTKRGPGLFAFGYEPFQDASETDEAMLAFLRDLEALRGGLASLSDAGKSGETARFFDAATVEAPDASAGSPGALPGATEDWAALIRHRLKAEAVCLGNPADGWALSPAGRRGDSSPSWADWDSLLRAMQPLGERGEVRTFTLDPENPLARLSREPLECAACLVPGSGGDDAVILSLRVRDANHVTADHAGQLQEVARSWTTHVGALRAAQAALVILSDTLLELTTEREEGANRGRTQRIRCLALLLAQELKLPRPVRAALHWACLRHGLGEAGDSKGEERSHEVLELLPDPWESLPFGKESLRILERSRAPRTPRNESPPSTNPLDGAGDCLVVAEVLEDLLSRGGSSRLCSLRPAMAFLEAGAGIAFDASVVQALGRLEQALPRHGWIFFLGRHTG